MKTSSVRISRAVIRGGDDVPFAGTGRPCYARLRKTMDRREFVMSLLGAGVVAPYVHAQSAPDWGGPVLDTHLHLRKDADACFTHMQGCGVTNAILLTRATDQDSAKQEMERRPGRFARSVTTDPALPDADKVFRDALKGGAV